MTDPLVDRGEDQGRRRGTGSMDRARAMGPVVEWVIFVLLAGLVLYLSTRRAGIDFSQRDLIDTDGYMRFVRIQQLADGGEWFMPTFQETNAPFGERLHWTRPIDLIVLALSWTMGFFAGDRPLYVAAVVSAPLMFFALAWVVRAGFGPFVPRSTRHVLLPGLLVALIPVSYAAPGRVDHHILLLLLVTIVVALVLRYHARGLRRGGLVGLGVCLALGLWVSVEFTVPIALTWLTLMAGFVISGERRAAVASTATFSVASMGAMIAVIIERGQGAGQVDYTAISLAHVAILGAGTLVAAGAWAIGLRGGTVVVRALVVGGSGAGLGGLVAVVFPGLAAGPFNAFDPVVRERWLSHVGELQPLFNGRPGSSLVFVAAPLLLGAISAIVIAVRSHRVQPGSIVLVTWFGVYSILALAQVRWALFGQLLAIPLLVTGLAGLFRPSHGRAMRIIRPVITAGILAGLPLLGVIIESDGESRDLDPVLCRLDDVFPTLRQISPTILLADPDAGPEIVYRTDHAVVAAPYGNGPAFRFLFDTMAGASAEAHRMLGERGAELILVCPGPQDLTYPPDPEGSFYAALVDGPLPNFVDPVPLTQDTDYLLFAVDS